MPRSEPQVFLVKRNAWALLRFRLARGLPVHRDGSGVSAGRASHARACSEAHAPPFGVREHCSLSAVRLQQKRSRFGCESPSCRGDASGGRGLRACLGGRVFSPREDHSLDGAASRRRCFRSDGEGVLDCTALHCQSPCACVSLCAKLRFVL